MKSHQGTVTYFRELVPAVSWQFRIFAVDEMGNQSIIDVEARARWLGLHGTIQVGDEVYVEGESKQGRREKK